MTHADTSSFMSRSSPGNHWFKVGYQQVIVADGEACHIMQEPERVVTQNGSQMGNSAITCMESQTASPGERQPYFLQLIPGASRQEPVYLYLRMCGKSFCHASGTTDMAIACRLDTIEDFHDPSSIQLSRAVLVPRTAPRNTSVTKCMPSITRVQAIAKDQI